MRFGTNELNKDARYWVLIDAQYHVTLSSERDETLQVNKKREAGISVERTSIQSLADGVKNIIALSQTVSLN